MLKGINLTLMIGPAVPVPAPKAVIEALESVQVNSQGAKTGFQLTFKISRNSSLLTTMLPAGYFDPMITRVIIIVTLKGLPNVISDGMVTRQELAPSSEPGQSKLTITGEDLSVLMDVVEIKRPFPNMPEIARIYTVLAPYAAFGIAPIAIPPVIFSIPSITSEIPTQSGTDLSYLNQMARRNGYVFFVEPNPLVPGSNFAYFGPDIRIPNPQKALNVNWDSHTNVESLSFSLDGLKKEVLIVTILDPITKKIPLPIPFPTVNPIRPPLGARLTPPAKVKFSDDLSGLKPTEAAKRILGMLVQSSDAVTSNGSLDVLRYGRMLRSRQLVGVRGAGVAYDGYYYVNSVTHNIKPGEYKQNFSLSRDGLISQTPRVLA
ncbi:MAG: hypothetical protein F6K42_22140 [Leptolyngbya sp. SIO1D8]|nr:hypothetical protein [Leptolyngbya sp. SIO1D8]